MERIADAVLNWTVLLLVMACLQGLTAKRAGEDWVKLGHALLFLRAVLAVLLA